MMLNAVITTDRKITKMSKTTVELHHNKINSQRILRSYCKTLNNKHVPTAKNLQALRYLKKKFLNDHS
jgi:hypothetical protein